MGAFECDNVGSALDPRRLREECIIAFKVYDFCRQQDCNNIHHFKHKNKCTSYLLYRQALSFLSKIL